MVNVFFKEHKNNIMNKRRNPYIPLLLSVLLIFAYVILILFVTIKCDFAKVLIEKFIHLFRNNEIAEALFAIIFFVIPVSVIFGIINRKPRS